MMLSGFMLRSSRITTRPHDVTRCSRCRRMGDKVQQDQRTDQCTWTFGSQPCRCEQQNLDLCFRSLFSSMHGMYCTIWIRNAAGLWHLRGGALQVAWARRRVHSYELNLQIDRYPRIPLLYCCVVHRVKCVIADFLFFRMWFQLSQVRCTNSVHRMCTESLQSEQRTLCPWVVPSHAYAVQCTHDCIRGQHDVQAFHKNGFCPWNARSLTCPALLKDNAACGRWPTWKFPLCISFASRDLIEKLCSFTECPGGRTNNLFHCVRCETGDKCDECISGMRWDGDSSSCASTQILLSDNCQHKFKIFEIFVCKPGHPNLFPKITIPISICDRLHRLLWGMQRRNNVPTMQERIHVEQWRHRMRLWACIKRLLSKFSDLCLSHEFVVWTGGFSRCELPAGLVRWPNWLCRLQEGVQVDCSRPAVQNMWT